MDIRMNQLHNTEIDKWIMERHYLKSVPAGAVLRLEFLDSNNKRIGAMMWGRPVARMLGRKNLLELTRMYFIDETERFIESKCLGMARKHIRKYYPQIKGLVAYCSEGEGHKGVVYMADNWFELGKSKGGSWENRKGRKDRDLSDKIRFVRSP